jgi:hypothetical protein
MIELIYAGHLGNNLFNYALGRLLSEELGHALSCRLPDPEPWSDIERKAGVVDKMPGHWQMFEDVPQERAGRIVERPQIRYVMGEKLLWHGQSLNLPWLLRNGRDHRIVLHGYFQRAEYYLPYADRIRRWFRMRPMDLPVKPGPRDAIVHVRRSLEMRILDRRLDVSFYPRALEQLKPERVYVCGLGLDAPLRAALEPWNPTYLDLDAGRTLYLMTRFRRIVMANSTFSWWGAFLSEAEQIIAPRPTRGIMSPDHAENDLRVLEPRYTWIEDVPLEPWRFLRPVPGWNFTRTEDAIVVNGPGRSPTTCRPTAALERLLRWLGPVNEPFGFYELHCDGVGTRWQLAPAILTLRRAGVLEECGREPGDASLEDLLSAKIPFGVS